MMLAANMQQWQIGCCLLSSAAHLSLSRVMAAPLGGDSPIAAQICTANPCACHSPCIAASLQLIVLNKDNEAFATVAANVGDRIIVQVHNKLQDPLSIHWHGMLQVWLCSAAVDCRWLRLSAGSTAAGCTLGSTRAVAS